MDALNAAEIAVQEHAVGSELVYTKSGKGKEEIAARKHGLTPRLRRLLVLIDGKKRVNELIAEYGYLGLTPEVLSQLTHEGYIEPLLPEWPADCDNDQADSGTDQETQFQALRQFYTETIKSTFGARGYLWQLKVERARSVNDFLEMHFEYLAAVQKAQGSDAARKLGYRLRLVLEGKLFGTNL